MWVLPALRYLGRPGTGAGTMEWFRRVGSAHHVGRSPTYTAFPRGTWERWENLFSVPPRGSVFIAGFPPAPVFTRVTGNDGVMYGNDGVNFFLISHNVQLHNKKPRHSRESGNPAK